MSGGARSPHRRLTGSSQRQYGPIVRPKSMKRIRVPSRRIKKTKFSPVDPGPESFRRSSRKSSEREYRERVNNQPVC